MQLDLAESLFLTICETSSRMGRSSEELRKVVESGVLLGAVQSLHSLSQQQERRQLLVDNSDTAEKQTDSIKNIQPLVALAGTVTWDQAIRRETVGALRQLSSDDKVRSHVHAAGALSVLMDIVKAGCAFRTSSEKNNVNADEEAQVAAASDAVLEEAVCGVRHLLLEQDCRHFVADAGGVKHLLALCQASIPGPILEGAVWAVWNLTRLQRTRGQLAAASGVDILVSLCIVPDTWQYGDIVITDSVQCGATWALSHISEEADIRPLVAQAGCVTALVKLCQASKNNHMLTGALNTLANLTLDSSIRVQVAATGGVPPLIELCQSSQHTGVLQGAATCLAHLCFDEGIRRKVVQAGALGTLLELCKLGLIKLSRTLEYDGVLQGAAGALCQLTDDDVIRTQVVAAGGLPPLIEMCMRGSGGGGNKHRLSDPVLLQSSGALTNLLKDPGMVAKVADAGGITAVVSLIANDSVTDFGVLERATASLVLWAQNPATRSRVAEEGAIRPLVELCSRLGSDNDSAGVLQGAALTLSLLGAEPTLRRAVASAGAITPLIRLCSTSRDDGVLLGAMGVLSAMTTDETTRSEVASSGGAVCLIKLCQECTHEGVLQAVSTSLQNLVTDQKTRQQVMESGGLEPLIRLCERCTNDQVLLGAAGALCLFCGDDETRPKVAAAAGPKPLVELCRTSTDEDVLQGSTGALWHLVKDTELRALVMEAGAVGPLVRVCRYSQSDSVLRLAAGALWHLIADSNVRLQVVEEGSANLSIGGGRDDGTEGGLLQALVGLCLNSSDAGVLSAAAAALQLLARDDACRQQVASAGAAGALICLCDTSHDIGVVSAAARALWYLLRDYTLRLQVGEGGKHGTAAQALIRLCKCALMQSKYEALDPPTSPSMQKAPADLVDIDEGLLRVVVESIRLIAGDGALRPHVLDCDGVWPILKLAQVGTKAVQEEALWALRNLAVEQAISREIARYRGVNVLLKLCNKAQQKLHQAEELRDDPETHSATIEVLADLSCDPLRAQTHAIWALARMAVDPAVRQELNDSGGVMMLAKLCIDTEGIHDEVLEGATNALKSLALDESTRVELEQKGGIAALIRLLQVSSSEGVLEQAAAALGNWAIDPSMRLKVLEGGGMAALLKLLQSSPHSGTLAAVAGAVSNLAEDDYLRTQLEEAGAVSCLIKLLKSGHDDDVLEQAALALTRFAVDKDMRKHIADGGGITALTDLCASETVEDSSLEAAASAIKAMATDSIMRNALSDAGAVEAMIRLCQVVEHDGVLEQASKALRNLTIDSNMRLIVSEAGAIPVLLELAQTNACDRALEGAVGALKNLLLEPSLRGTVVQEDGIAILIRLCRLHQHDGVIEQATKAVRNLANDASLRPKLVQTGGILALVKLLESRTACQSLEGAASAIKSLAADISIHPALEEAGAMDALIHLCRTCKHERVLEQASKALYEWSYDRQNATSRDVAAVPLNGSESLPTDLAVPIAARVSENLLASNGATAMISVCELPAKTRSGALQGAAGVLKNIAKYPALRPTLGMHSAAVIASLLHLCITASNHGVLAQASLALKFLTQHADSADTGGETRELRLKFLNATHPTKSTGIVALLRVTEHICATLDLSKRKDEGEAAQEGVLSCLHQLLQEREGRLQFDHLLKIGGINSTAIQALVGLCCSQNYQVARAATSAVLIASLEVCNTKTKSPVLYTEYVAAVHQTEGNYDGKRVDIVGTACGDVIDLATPRSAVFEKWKQNEATAGLVGIFECGGDINSVSERSKFLVGLDATLQLWQLTQDEILCVFCLVVWHDRWENSEEEVRQQLAEAGRVEAVIQLLELSASGQAGSPLLLRSLAVRALRVLTATDAIRNKVVQAGGLALLLQLIHLPEHGYTLHDSVWALHNLTLEESICSKLVKDAQGGNHVQNTNAVLILLEHVRMGEKYNVELHQSKEQQDSDHPDKMNNDILCEVTGVLQRLSEFAYSAESVLGASKNIIHSLIADAGGVRTLLNLCTYCEHKGVLQHVTWCLKYLCVAEDVRSQIAATKGTVHMLIRLCTPDAEGAVFESSSDNAGALSGAAGVVAQMSVDENFGQQLVEAKILTALIRLCSSSESKIQPPEVLAASAAALNALASHASLKGAVAQAGAVQVLMGLSEKSDDPQVLEQATAALQHLAEAGGAEALIQVCTTQTDPSMLQQALSQLRELATTKSKRAQIVDGDGVPALVHLCRTQQNKHVLIEVSWTLRLLTEDLTTRRAVAKAGAVPALVNLCGCEHERVLERVAWALRNLTKDKKTRPLVVEAGGVGALVNLCDKCNTHRGILEETCWALRILAEDDKIRPQVAEAGGVVALIKLCETSKHRVVLEEATTALKLLTES